MAVVTMANLWEALLGFAALAWTLMGFAYMCICHPPKSKDKKEGA